jgi:hypothetical protein
VLTALRWPQEASGSEYRSRSGPFLLRNLCPFAYAGMSLASMAMFVGLNVSSEGVGFHFSTTNVSNVEDHKILDFLNSPTFTSGLKLAETAQPAIKPLTDIAVGLGKTFLTRSENVLVQDVYLGQRLRETEQLGFAKSPLR